MKNFITIQLTKILKYVTILLRTELYISNPDKKTCLVRMTRGCRKREDRFSLPISYIILSAFPKLVLAVRPTLLLCTAVRRNSEHEQLQYVTSALRNEKRRAARFYFYCYC